LDGDNKALLGSTGKIFSPAYLASKGWVALRMDVGKVDWDEVETCCWEAYALIRRSDCGTGESED